MTEFGEDDVYGPWSLPEKTTVKMPDGTPIEVEWQYRNEEDPDTRILSAVALDSIDYADHNVSAGVYDYIHEQLGPLARRALGPSRDELLKLWRVVTSYRDKVEITCAETIYQTDRCQLDATQFMGTCIEVVGYGTYDEDSDKYVSPGV